MVGNIGDILWMASGNLEKCEYSFVFEDYAAENNMKAFSYRRTL